MTIKLIDGFAEWKGNKECLKLKHWYIQDGRLKYFEALCPHGLSDLDWCDAVPSQHITSAVTWIKEEAIIGAEKTTCGDTISYYPEYRGYLDKYPVRGVEKWITDLNKLALIVLNSTSFHSLVKKDFSLPRCLLKTWQAQQIEQIASDFAKSVAVQTYFKKKAEEMADFWVNNLGSIGQTGDVMADILQALALKNEEAPLAQDRVKFKEALISHCLESFNEGIVPFYDTDYKVKGHLRKVLEKNDLMHLEKHFPVKTWKHFNFSDAPSIERSESLCL
jgi:hypothetical protein